MASEPVSIIHWHDAEDTPPEGRQALFVWFGGSDPVGMHCYFGPFAANFIERMRPHGLKRWALMPMPGDLTRSDLTDALHWYEKAAAQANDPKVWERVERIRAELKEDESNA